MCLSQEVKISMCFNVFVTGGEVLSVFVTRGEDLGVFQCVCHRR